VRRAVVAVALALGLLACGDDDSTVVAPTTTATEATTAAPTTTAVPATTAPSTTVPPTTTTTAPAWVVGASTLPLRPDGFGEIEPTPPPLVNRSLPTVDVLAPPASGGFESSITPISDEVRARMGGTWFDGCPVGLDDLRYVTVSFRGFDGDAHTGELIVNASEAEGVVGVFHQLFDADFPIEEMRIVTDADMAAPPTGDGNNTAAFVCRPVRRGRRFSAHASGLAIDLDPFQNPYTTDDIVVPELASAYLDRSDVRPGMILDGGVAVEAFAAIGWDWGGRWDDPVDRMHFTATGG
jgi:hypothetical protein